MTTAVLHYTLIAAQALIALAMVFTTYRVLRGPRAQDRVLALDTLYVNALVVTVIEGMRTGVTLYFEVALVIAMLGFVATVALAKFLLRGEVIE
jgi:multicomponent K+:H+ antiporter subunit F